MSPIIEAVTEPIVVGEGPFWSSKNQTLYYVGVYDASINSYNSVTKEHRSVKIGNTDTKNFIHLNEFLINYYLTCGTHINICKHFTTLN